LFLIKTYSLKAWGCVFYVFILVFIRNFKKCTRLLRQLADSAGKGGKIMEKILLYIFLWSCVVYTTYKLLEFITKKILGGRTAQEKAEEKRLRKRHTVDSAPSVVDPPIL
jgi:hypothetical protein